MMDLAKKKQNQIRYNLHRDLRAMDYKVLARERTIYVYFNTPPPSKAIRLRDEFGYSIQTEIFKNQKTHHD